MHDGKLVASECPAASPALNEARVDFNTEMPHVYIYGGYGKYDIDAVLLDAKQALSLLEWLRQQEETLKQKAQEVNNGTSTD